MYQKVGALASVINFAATGSVTLAIGHTVAAGNGVVLYIAYNGASHLTVSSVKNQSGTSLTFVEGANVGSSGANGATTQNLVWVPNCGGATSIALTLSGAPATLFLGIQEFSGLQSTIDASAVYDNAQAPGGTDAFTTGDVIASNAADRGAALIVMGLPYSGVTMAPATQWSGLNLNMTGNNGVIADKRTVSNDCKGVLTTTANPQSMLLIVIDEAANCPVLNTKPAAQYAASGATATFSVAATASAGSLSYQWKKNGTNVGSNSSSYTTGTLSTSDDGAKVTVTVTDSNGSVTSEQVGLWITDLSASNAYGPKIDSAWLYRSSRSGNSKEAVRGYALLRDQIIQQRAAGDNARFKVWSDWMGFSTASSGAMVGTAAMTFGASAIPHRPLAGTASMTLAASATAKGLGKMSGSAAATFAASGTTQKAFIKQFVAGDTAPGNVGNVASDGTNFFFPIAFPKGTSPGSTIQVWAGCFPNSGASSIASASDANGAYTLQETQAAIAGGNAYWKQFVKQNAAAIGPGTYSQATGTTTTTLSDTNQAWTTNQWAGKTLIDLASGRTYTVTSNTATVLTFSTGTAPTTNCKYVVGDFIKVVLGGTGPSAGTLYCVGAAAEVTNAALTGGLTHSSGLNTVGASGTDTVTSGTAANGSQSGIMLGVSVQASTSAVANHGTGFTAFQAFFQADAGFNTALLEYQRFTNPGTSAATFNPSAAGSFGTFMAFIQDAGSGGNLVGSVTVTFAGSATAKGLGKVSVTSALTFAQSAGLKGLGKVSGSSALTFAQSAGLKGIGKVTGSSAVAFSESASLKGLGKMAGSSAVAFSESASLKGAGTIAGSTALAFAQSASLKGLGKAAGSAAVSFSESASLRGAGSMSGTGAAVFAASATPKGLGSMAGSAAIAFSATATRSSALVGSAAVTFSESASLRGLGSMAGTAALAFTASANRSNKIVGSSAIVFAQSATIRGSGAMQASAALAFNQSATARGLGKIVGSSAVVFSESAALTGAGRMAGSSAAAFSESASLKGLGSMAGTAAIAFGASASRSSSMVGSSAMVFAQSATIAARGKLAGASALLFAETGALGGVGRVKATVALTFSESASLRGLGAMAGTGAAAFAGSAKARGAGKMSGTAAIAFAAAAATSGSSAMKGSAALAFAQSASISARGALRATATVTFAQSAALRGLAKMSGTAAVSFSESGNLRLISKIQGSSAAVFAASATLGGKARSAASAAMAFSGAAHLAGMGRMRGTAAMVFAASASEGQKIPISGSAALTLDASGNLAGRGRLAGVCTVTLASSATLVGFGRMHGSAAVIFGASGQLVGAHFETPPSRVQVVSNSDNARDQQVTNLAGSRTGRVRNVNRPGRIQREEP